MLPGRDLSALLPFGVSVTFSLLASGAVAINYIWPRISKRALHSAERPLLHLHLFRFIGLAFIVPGVVGVNLESRFAEPAAYGDLIATILAWMTILIGTRRYSRAALWVFNL
jgi:cbb3-type cytochrome oxidase subunit 1